MAWGRCPFRPRTSARHIAADVRNDLLDETVGSATQDDEAFM